MQSFLRIDKESHFPLRNIPFGVFSTPNLSKRVGVAIGEFVLDLRALEEAGILKSRFFQTEDLYTFISAGKGAWRGTRADVQDLLRHDNPTLRDHAGLRESTLIPQSQVTMHLPLRIGDYTDFYSSKEHATNVGSMFRDPNNALLPNWLHIPVGYHGRASSVVVSGTPIRRPVGQTKDDQAEAPSFGPTRLLDFELEVGWIVGKGNELGSPVPIDQAYDHVFGMVLVNDWSARDIQKWEYVPLGPFLAKSFATSISPWVVTMDALEEFRVPGPVQEPAPLPYLRREGNWSFDIELEVAIQSEKLTSPEVIARSNAKYLYWNICQQLAHHTSNGCNLQIGDLLASGTISGPSPAQYGSLLELTWKGSKPIVLPSGEELKFLRDGDVLSIQGCTPVKDGYRVGFGSVVGQILPALR